MEAIKMKPVWSAARKHVPLIIIIILAITTGIFGSMLFAGKEKKGYVNLQKVYDEFKLKKELDEKLIAFQTRNQQSLDSLRVGVNSVVRQLQQLDTVHEKDAFHSLNFEYNTRREEYFNKQNSVNQQNDALTNNYIAQIWKQVNEYVTEYGKQNHYEIIMGGDGKGSVMYASDGIDITKEITDYINKRYKGEQ